VSKKILTKSFFFFFFFSPQKKKRAILCLYMNENYRAEGRAMDSSNDRQLSVAPKSMEPMFKEE
jgi:hypothetical protein